MNERQNDLEDLGLDGGALRGGAQRILNRDGTFNVRREGRSFVQSVNPYHLLLSASWTQFNLILLGLYLSITVVFALGFFVVGADSMGGSTASSLFDRMAESFFFSVQTITTVGYGHLFPIGTMANLLVTFEAAVGMAGIAVAAGLIFARVSVPSAKVLFSNTALIDGESAKPSFKFRMVNGARSELLDATARLILAKTDTRFGIRTRRFHELALERDRIAFFTLDWTLQHRVTEDSPLHGMSAKHLEDAKVEFLVLVNAVDDGASQRVHARSSYLWNEVTWDKRFVDMYRRDSDGRTSVDLRLLHDVEAISLRSDQETTIWDV